MAKTSAQIALRSAPIVPLEAILRTEELTRRPSRRPDYETENRALTALVQVLADSPRTVPQTLADTILKMLDADSSGISLLTKDKKSFEWAAIAGAWQPHLGGGTPRDFSPCGDVLDCNAPLLFTHWERRYPYLLEAVPLAEEGLLVPFFVKGKAVGTIWAIAHSNRRRFDAEDLRQLESLGRFASGAYQKTVELRRTQDRRRAALNLMEDAVQARQGMEALNRALQESEERLKILADNIPILCWTADADGSIYWYNRRWFDYTGTTLEEMRGWGWRAVHHPDHVDRVVAKIKHSFDTGEIWEDTFPLRSQDGEYRWFLSRATPIRDAQGKITRWFGTNTDITERLKAEQRQQLLSNELAHRSRNLLAVIQTIISRSLCGTRSLAEHREALMQRIQALARCQTMLVNGAFEGAPLAEIVRLEFEAFPGRVTAAGPGVTLNPKATQTFALLAHELATNAIKYGALSRPDGSIAINWSIKNTGAQARFKFQWQERGGPPLVPPTHQGFGRVLIEKVTAQDFGAQPKIDYAPEGLSYEIDAPLSAVAGGTAVLDGRSIGEDVSRAE